MTPERETKTTCRVCGSKVILHTSTEGTSWYVHDTSEMDELRFENEALKKDIDRADERIRNQYNRLKQLSGSTG